MKQINFNSLTIILLGFLIKSLVWAGDGHHGGYVGGGHFGGYHGLDIHFGYGLGLGYDLGYYGYGLPHYYPYPPVVTVPASPVVASPPTHIQHNVSSAPQSQSSYWYYCRNPEGYYPYVRECSGDWEKISPQPPAQ